MTTCERSWIARRFDWVYSWKVSVYSGGSGKNFFFHDKKKRNVRRFLCRSIGRRARGAWKRARPERVCLHCIEVCSLKTLLPYNQSPVHVTLHHAPYHRQAGDTVERQKTRVRREGKGGMVLIFDIKAKCLFVNYWPPSPGVMAWKRGPSC